DAFERALRLRVPAEADLGLGEQPSRFQIRGRRPEPSFERGRLRRQSARQAPERHDVLTGFALELFVVPALFEQALPNAEGRVVMDLSAVSRGRRGPGPLERDGERFLGANRFRLELDG